MTSGYKHVSRSLYRREWFDVGLWIARWVPRSFLRAAAGFSGWIYAVTHPAKARVAAANVRNVVPGTPVAASGIYVQFARMLADYFVAGARGDKAIRRMTGTRGGMII